MIQANELRIGNFTVAIGDKWETQTNQWKKGDIMKIDLYDLAVINGCNRRKEESPYAPIPLTPEILEKAGFKKDEEYNCLYLSFGLFQIRTWSDGSVGLSVEEYNCTQIKYAHQLQNIYFALTGGEELNIEL